APLNRPKLPPRDHGRGDRSGASGARSPSARPRPRGPVRPLVPRPPMVARFRRARVEHGNDAGSRDGSAIPATEDAARRRPAAAKTGNSLVDGALVVLDHAV